MFNIGEVIFYPVYGAGYIENIKREEVYGEIYTFYIIKFINNIDIMIPTNSNKLENIRKGISSSQCNDILNLLSNKAIDLPKKWSERYRIYNNAIRKGNIFELSALLRDIGYLSRKRKLSKSDIKIFNNILSMVVGEISLVLKLDYEDIKNRIYNIIDIREES